MVLYGHTREHSASALRVYDRILRLPANVRALAIHHEECRAVVSGAAPLPIPKGRAVG